MKKTSPCFIIHLTYGNSRKYNGVRFLSIKKIAKEAGVSTATVSRVLNNPGYKCSSEELRERIWKIARELNYMPNEAARNLKKGITDTSQKVWYLDVLMTRTGNLETDPFFSELLRVIESEIHRQGCILMHIFHQPLFSNDRKCRTENIDKVIAQMEPDGDIRSDGLIIIGKCNDNVLKKLSAKYRSIVSVNRNLKCLNKYKNRYYVPSIISSDDIEEAQYTKPMLTTVRLPKEEMGKFALYLLIDRLGGGHKGIVRTELEGKLMIRESCTLVENANRMEYYI